MKYFTVLIISISTLLSAETVSLEKAKASALENNYGYAIAKETLNYSELSTKSAFAGFLPTASFSAGYTLYTPEVEISSFNFTTMSSVSMTQEDRTAFSIRVSQPLFTGGKVWNNYKIASGSEEMSRNTLTSEMFKLLADVESQYLSVLEAQEMMKIAEESIVLSKKNEETAKIKFDSGLISRADFLKNSSARASSEVSLVNAEKILQLARISFSNITGLKEFELETLEHEKCEDIIKGLCNMEPADITLKVQRLREVALKNNIDLKNAVLGREINEKKISVSKGSFLPTLSLSYSTEWSKTNLTDEYSNSGAVALSASVPILPLYDNYITLEKSRIDLKRSELSEKQLEDNISTLINTYLYTLVSGSKQLQSSITAVELADETYKSVEERANSGLSTEDELNTARLSLIQAKYDQTSVYYSILKTKTELMRVLGITDGNELLKLF